MVFFSTGCVRPVILKVWTSCWSRTGGVTLQHSDSKGSVYLLSTPVFFGTLLHFAKKPEKRKFSLLHRRRGSDGGGVQGAVSTLPRIRRVPENTKQTLM